MGEEEIRSGILVHYDLVKSGEIKKAAQDTYNTMLKTLERETKIAMAGGGFQFLKTVGDALVFLGDDPNKLFRAFKTAKRELDRIKVDKKDILIRAVAHSGPYQHNIDKNDISGINVDCLFKMDKAGEVGTIAVSNAFFKNFEPLINFDEVNLSNEKIWEDAPKTCEGVNPLRIATFPDFKKTGAPQSEASINLEHLPQPTTELVGRGNCLIDLNAAFDNPDIAIVSLIAGGGVGKSALTCEWLDRLARDGYKGAVKVFGWSAYSQGSHETATNSTVFFQKALPFFGHEGDLPTSDEEKAKALADLLKGQKCLLVLDGVEPLQHRTDIQRGWFSDVGFSVLMRNIGRNGLDNGGLILISSRQPIVELERYEKSSCPKIKLDNLTNEEGRELLLSLGVRDFQDQAIDIAKKLGGHALTLALLGKLLKNQHGGDIRMTDRIENLLEEEEEGEHAKHVLEHYIKLWGEGSAEHLFMHMLGLFDRPLDQDAKDALLKDAQFVKPLAELDTAGWNAFMTHLKVAGLVQVKEDDLHIEQWDAHPIIRDYFGKHFDKENREEWKDAHKVLFEFFQKAPEKKQPDTPEELEPLYRAVHHGCKAEKYKKALDDVYYDRIRRGKEAYSVKKLGLYANDLAAISGFFPKGWEKPVSKGLSESAQGFLLAEASHCLMSLGRMREAIEPRRAVLQIWEKQKDWENASRSARNLVDLMLPTGKLEDALEAANMGINFTGNIDEGKDKEFSRVVNHAYLADVLHRMGNLSESFKEFEKAEEIQSECQPENKWLYSTAGAQYCALLIDTAENEEHLNKVFERGKYGLKIAERNKWLLDIALDRLTIGCALVALGKHSEAKEELDAAVNGIRKASMTLLTPDFLLARASFLRKQKEFEDAGRDLEEAMEISQRCGMLLYESECWLLDGNIHLDTLDKGGSIDKAKEAYQKAKTQIDHMKYGLRYSEVELLAARIAFYDDDKPNALERLKKAEGRMVEIGMHGLKADLATVRTEIKG